MRMNMNRNTAVILVLLGLAVLGAAMRSNLAEWFMSRLLILPGIIIGLSFHEFAHAYAAVKLGDTTPRFQGRVTINPMSHVDPIGFLCLLLVGFGWGVPVQINPRSFKNPRRDEFIVSIAGVVMNFIIAVVFVGIFRLLFAISPAFLYGNLGSVITEIVADTIQINLVLMVFNLIPIPPLDGFGIITQIFNLRNTKIYWTLYQYGQLILILMIVFNITDLIITPLVIRLYLLVMGIFF